MDGVREQLERILASRTFRSSDRLSRFLRFAVDTTERGEEDRIKEYTIGVDVFDRDTSYDPRLDPVVRVEARRLRAKLSDYYENEGRNDPVRIVLPKGSYVPVFDRNVKSDHRWPRRVMIAALVVAAVAAGSLWRIRPRMRVVILPMRTFSPPDGEEMRGLADSVAEAVIRALSPERDLSVVSWPTATSYQARDKRPPDIARELGADALAVVWARAYPDKVMLTVHLIGAAKDEKLWAQAYTLPAGTRESPPSLPGEIAAQMIKSLRERR